MRRNGLGFVKTDWLPLVTLAIIVGGGLWTATRCELAGHESLGSVDELTRPLRLEALQSGADEELFLGLRVFHYRAQPIGEAAFEDVFYDTEQWDLFRMGYSYRFRLRKEADPGERYSVRLKQESRFVAEGNNRLDVRSALTDSFGTSVLGGAWQQAVSEGAGLEAPEGLRALLRELEIEPTNVRPRLQVELRRKRFDVSDKGWNWFELDQEIWSFRLLESNERINFEDFVLDTRLKTDDLELARRVRSMAEICEMFSKMRPVKLAPHERAILRLVHTDSIGTPL